MRVRQMWCVVVAMMLVLIAGTAQSQVNTVNLSGTVLDPQNLAVAGAKVTAKNLANGAERTVDSDATGAYEIVGLPPGHYSITAEAKGFSTLLDPDVTLTLGIAAEYDPHLTVAAGEQVVTVTTETELIETTKSTVSNNVSQTQINNLPINGRNYIDFTLLDSQANRDSAPSIGAAPTSGLNFGGQRARSNEISVDGADAVDNTINGVRATVSQEAVQEFQLITSNYMPEYGRATGGVVNIVTKSGGNQIHGDMFGFLRNKAIQARNPFSVQVDPITGAVTGVKQAFTRVQAGATIGGSIKKDKTFYFFSYEATRREETGFTDIGVAQPGTGPFGLLPSTTPVIPGVTLLLTPGQQAFVNNPLVLSTPAGQMLAAQVFALAGSGSSVATAGIDPGIVSGAGPGARFPIPVDGATLAPLPASFVPLNSLIGNYPITEKTSLYSLRLDQIWNHHNSSFLRIGISPSLANGIEVNAQNQNFGQNASTRASLQQTRDFSIVGQHSTIIEDNVFNEFHYQYARRGLHYGFSQQPGGGNVGVNIPGFAFFGREPFSTVDRIERRNQWTDNVTWVSGAHTIKFGMDVNFVQISSNLPIIFQLDFGGLFNIGGLTAGNLGLPSSVSGVALPGFSAVQAYGLGLPQNFIQGIGSAPQPHFHNTTLGVFLQDSWKINSRFTMNYGLRYDIEFTPRFGAATPLNAAAEQAVNVLEGIPVYTKAVQPRLGFAWDPTGSGKTVIRAGYGIFFDHPPLGIAFNSTTADGTRNSQLILPGSTPTGLPFTLDPAALNASSVFQGVFNPGGIPGITYEPNGQRFNPFQSSFFNNQNFLAAGVPLGLLPFTFPVARSFTYGYAQQGSLGVERQLSSDWKIGATYNYTHGLHLNRPRDINTPDPTQLVTNFRNAVAAGFAPSSPFGVSAVAPVTGTPVCQFTQAIPGLVSILNNCLDPTLNGQTVATAAAFNFFRPSGPNPSFAGLVGGYPTLVGIAKSFGFPVGYFKNGVPVQVPYSSIDQQESSGNSLYNALTITVSKRATHHTQLYSSYTWSHAIDDSTDLQSLLEPQNDHFTNLERANSSFDQRHRWVTSAVFQSPYKTSDEGFVHKFLADFTVAPIFDVSSGRPYTVLTGTDYNFNFGSNTDRPSVVPLNTPGAVTSPFIHNVAFSLPTVCASTITLLGQPISPPLGCDGNLGRNPFTRPGFFTIDLRVSRKFYFNERWNLEAIAEGFNMLNRFNVADVNVLCDPGAGQGACNAGQPSAALDPRQFQFALKLNF